MKSASEPEVTKVGPKGYIHGWVFVGTGADGLGDKLRGTASKMDAAGAHESAEHLRNAAAVADKAKDGHISPGASKKLFNHLGEANLAASRSGHEGTHLAERAGHMNDVITRQRAASKVRRDAKNLEETNRIRAEFGHAPLDRLPTDEEAHLNAHDVYLRHHADHRAEAEALSPAQREVYDQAIASGKFHNTALQHAQSAPAPAPNSGTPPLLGNRGMPKWARDEVNALSPGQRKTYRRAVKNGADHSSAIYQAQSS